MAAENLLNVRLLGVPTIMWGDQTLSIQRRMARVFIYYLASHPSMVSRSDLVVLFWPESPNSRQQLRDLLSKLRAELPDSEIIQFQSILPQNWTVENYSEILNNSEEIPIIQWFCNSIFVSSMITLLVLTVDSLAAYALARLNLPGGKWLFILIVATLMIPFQMLLVPVYLILNYLGWLDTHLALIFPAGAGAFGVFLLRQFFLGIPKEYEEAAKTLGANAFQTFRDVTLPLLLPAILAGALFSFTISFDDITATLFWATAQNQTVPVKIFSMLRNSISPEINALDAVMIVLTVATPLLAGYLSRKFSKEKP